MQFRTDIGFAFYPGASEAVNAAVLAQLMENLIAVNLIWRRHNPKAPRLYDTSVRYGRTEVWDSAPDLYVRGHGDCKTLTAARVAELRYDGIEASPCHRGAVVRNPRTGREHTEYHILVQKFGRRRGLVGPRIIVAEDPSAKMGMAEYYAAQGLQLVSVGT